MATVSVDDFEIKERVTPPSDAKFIAAMLSPSIILFFTGIAVPLFLALYLSFAFSEGGVFIGPPTGFDNFERFLKPTYFPREEGDVVPRFSSDFYRYFFQTIFFVVVTVMLEFILGMAFALVLNEDFRGRGIVRTAVLIPWAIPTVVSATFFLEIFAPVGNYGLINNIIVMLGGRPVEFYGEVLANFGENGLLMPIQTFPFISFNADNPIVYTYTMFTVIVIEVWKTTPFVGLLILAGLQTIPKDLYKAADIEGASLWQKFRYITWPNVKGPASIAILFRTINAIRIYDSVVVFNDESVQSITVLAVRAWDQQFFGVASAMAVSALLLVGLAALLIFKGNKYVYLSTYVLFFILFHRWWIFGLVALLGGLALYYGYEYYEKEFGSSKEYKFDPESIKYVEEKRLVKKVTFYSLVVFLVLFALLPFIWVINRSFRNPCRNIDPADGCTTSAPSQQAFELFPKYPSLQSYKILFPKTNIINIILGQTEGQTVNFGTALIWSLILAGLTALIVIAIGSLVGAILAKYQFPGQNPFITMIFAMSALPPIIIIIPYLVELNRLKKLGINFEGTFLGPILPLLLPYVAFNLPLGVFLLQSFFAEIPDDLIKAAKVDGASNFQIFRRILLPLTRPGIFTTGMMVFIYAWNELLFARIFLVGDQDKWTVPLAILQFNKTSSGLTGIPWTPQLVLAAASVVATVPLIILVLIFQKNLIQGITAGAVKG